MMKNLIISSIVAFFSISIGYTAEYVISGQVLDQYDQPIPNIEVESSLLGESTLTDSQGNWVLGDQTTTIDKFENQEQFQINNLILTTTTTNVKISLYDILGGQSFQVNLGTSLELDLRPILNQSNLGKHFLIVEGEGNTKSYSLIHTRNSIQLIPLKSNKVSLSPPSAVDTVKYKAYGQIITFIENNTSQTGMAQKIEMKTIHGSVSEGGSSRQVDTVVAKIEGQNLIESIVVPLEYNAGTNEYSGTVFFEFSDIDTNQYELFVEIKDVGGEVHTQTNQLRFIDTLDAIVIDPVQLESKHPMPESEATNMFGDTIARVSINDTIIIHLNSLTADGVNGSIIQAWIDFNQTGYRELSSDTAHVLAPNSGGNITWKIKMMDNDSNVVESDLKTLEVVQDIPILTVIPSRLNLIYNSGDTLSYSAQTTQEFGSIVKYEWDCGSGYVVGASTHTCTFADIYRHISVRITDDDQNVVEKAGNHTRWVPSYAGSNVGYNVGHMTAEAKNANGQYYIFGASYGISDCPTGDSQQSGVSDCGYFGWNYNDFQKGDSLDFLLNISSYNDPFNYGYAESAIHIIFSGTNFDNALVGLVDSNSVVKITAQIPLGKVITLKAREKSESYLLSKPFVTLTGTGALSNYQFTMTDFQPELWDPRTPDYSIVTSMDFARSQAAKSKGEPIGDTSDWPIVITNFVIE